MAGTAWCWYATTLEPHLLTKYGINSAQTGLVFLSPALTYTIFSPWVGKLYDHGWGGLKIILSGSWIITIAFLCMGPLSLVEECSGVWVIITSMGLQGIGSCFVYIGTSLTMIGAIEEYGLPNTEHSRGLVLSIWTSACFLGQAIGSTAGGLVSAWVRFEYGLLFEALILLTTSIIVIVLSNCINNSTTACDEGLKYGSNVESSKSTL